MKGWSLSNSTLALQDSAWLLSTFCTLHRRSFDAALFAQRHPHALTLEELQGPADELGLAL